MVVIKTHKVPKKWRKLFKLIPGYDVFALAGDCYFDVAAAEHVCEFFATCLKHPVATEAVPAGSPFVLLPWEEAIVGCLFGWKKPNGLRRYRELFLYVAKKNGKSCLTAGIIVYVLTQDGELGAEVYSAAANKDQTGNVFRPVVAFIKQEPALSGVLRVYGATGGAQRKSVVHEESSSSYVCLCSDADTVDGANVHLVVIDEFHRHKKADLAHTLKDSMAARAQPLALVTTTADFNHPSPCNVARDYAIAVRDNPGDPNKPGYDPTLLPAVFELPKGANYTDESMWKFPNPSLDVTLTREYLRQLVRRAADSPTDENHVRRLHFNEITDADVAAITMAMWDPCEGSVDPDALKGRECYAGLDLSSTCDMTAFVLLFPDEDGGFKLLPTFWVPEDLTRPGSHKNCELYAAWARSGLLRTTPGNIIDYAFIRRDINKLGQSYVIRQIAVDYDWQGVQLSTELGEQDGFTMHPFRQGFRSFGMPTAKFLTAIVGQQLEHGGNPILRWQAGNLVVALDAAGNKKPDKNPKGKPGNKIDGIVCAIMAYGMYLLGDEAAPVCNFAFVDA